MKVPATPELPSETAAPVPETPTPSLPSPPAIGQWPGWVKFVDVAAIFLVVLAAFLVASFVARNSDQWLHFASGRALLKGDYSFGTDPFSHATAGRTWVNHSWLYGVVTYLLYNSDTTGFVLIAIKAFLFAAAFGIVNLIRRPGQTIWPWVLVSLVAVLSAAPHSGLRPLIGTGVFLAITLAVLLGRDWKTGAKLNTILLAIVFWLWASTDTWFILGPLCVALVLLGEWLQATVLRPKVETVDADAVSCKPLVRALLVGLLACSLTPHHLRVWQLPFELGLTLPANTKLDDELSLLTLSPLDAQKYMDVASRGNNLNGLAFAFLLVGGGIVLAAGFSRSRVSHILLWVAFAGLALIQWRLILLFSIAAIPLIANGLSQFLEGVRLGSLDRPRTKLLLLLSGLGRILGLPAVVLFVISAYPGWLHHKPFVPALTQKVAWAVEPDVGLKRSAELLNRWRETGRIPDDYRGFIANIELANHIAWFAPKEKVFVNGRFGFHARELTDFIAARRLLLRRQQPIELSEAEQFHELGQKHDLTYIVYSGTNFPPNPVDLRPIIQLTAPKVGYGLWHVDGRFAVLGDTTAKKANEKVFREMAFDPVRLAFDPKEVTPVPAPPDGLIKPVLETNFLDAFFAELPKLPAIETLDSDVWNILGTIHTQNDFQTRVTNAIPVANVVSYPIDAGRVLDAAYRVTDVSTAYRILALRAAYRGIASNPDDPFAYLALAKASEPGRFSLTGLNPDVQQQLQRAGLRQFVDRLPPVALSRSEQMIESGMSAALQLSQIYQPPNAVNNNTGRPIPVLPEPGAEMFRRMGEYWQRFIYPGLEQKEAEAKKKDLQKMVNMMEEIGAPANDSYQNAIRNKTDVSVHILEALQRGLLLQASAKFAENWQTQPPNVIVNMVHAYTTLGQLNEADFYLRRLEEQIAEAQKEGKLNREMMAIVQAVEQQRVTLWHLRGDFAKAGEALERTPMQPLPAPMKQVIVQALKQSPTNGLREYVAQPSSLLAGPGGAGIFVAQAYADQCVASWRSQSGFFLMRAMMQILEGKIDDAEVRLRQALKPDGIELPAYLQERQLAETYLRLIERAKATK